MPFPIPADWTDETPAATVHADAHNDAASFLNKFATGGAAADVLTKGSSTDGDVDWAPPAVTAADLAAETARAEAAEATAQSNAKASAMSFAVIFGS